jgi:hypothetical protein
MRGPDRHHRPAGRYWPDGCSDTRASISRLVRPSSRRPGRSLGCGRGSNRRLATGRDMLWTPNPGRTARRDALAGCLLSGLRRPWQGESTCGPSGRHPLASVGPPGTAQMPRCSGLHTPSTSQSPRRRSVPPEIDIHLQNLMIGSPEYQLSPARRRLPQNRVDFDLFCAVRHSIPELVLPSCGGRQEGAGAGPTQSRRGEPRAGRRAVFEASRPGPP